MRFTVNPFSKRLDAFEADVGPAGDVEFLAGDSGGNIAPTAAGVISVLGNPDINVAGSGNQLQMTNLTKLTPYVVDAAAGAAPYSTIQSAITAAEATGNSEVVLVRSGTFTEDLTFTTGTVALVGMGEQSTFISGVHTPPVAGFLNIWRANLASATHLFSSAAAGSADIIVEDITANCTNGYSFNLPNWTGSIAVFDIGNAGTNDGFINNTAGASFFAFATGLGNGTVNSMILSGTSLITTSDITCPMSLQGTGTTSFNNCSFTQTITTAATNTVTISNSTISSSATAAISHGSANPLSLSNVTIDSSNSPAIAGAGAGSLTLADVTFLDDTTVSSSLTQVTTAITKTGGIYSSTQSLDEGDHLKLTATGQTIGAVTADLYTLALGATASAYFFTVSVVGFALGTALSVGYRLRGTFETDGATSSIAGSGSSDEEEETGATLANAQLIASGNNAIIRVTGVGGSTFNWRVIIEWVRSE